MDLQEVGWGQVLDCSGSGFGQFAGFLNTVMDLGLPENLGNFLTI